MGTTSTRLVIIGPGGSGRTTALRDWADDIDRRIDGQVAWLRGSAERSITPGGTRRSLELITGLSNDDALAVDDAQWFDIEVLESIEAISDRIPVAVATSGWPESAAMRATIEALTIREAPLRLGPLDTPGVAGVIAGHPHSTALPADEVHRLTCGNVALCAGLLEHGWEGDGTPMPAVLADDVVRWVRASGPGVLDATQMMAMGVGWSIANEVVAADTGLTDVERLLTVSGLVSDHELIPLVAAAIDADLTDADRRLHATRLEPLAARLPRDTRAKLVLATPPDPSDPTGNASERATAALRLGDARASEFVAALGDLDAPAAAAAAFTLDMRSLRWDRASQRRLAPPLGGPLLELAAALSGDLGGDHDAAASGTASNDAGDARTPDREVLDDLLDGVRLLATGDARSVGQTIRAIDTACGRDFDLGVGWTPAAVGALVALSAGDAAAAQTMASLAIDTGLGGPGEQASHHLLAAFAGIMLGDYSAALDLVRAGAGAAWSYRDQVLLAALDAAIARRSGDTTRLRDAWQRSEPLLLRESVSWLMFDPILEILAAGARLDDRQRAVRLADQLVEQMSGWSEPNCGAVNAHWLRLQLAIGSEDWAGVAAAGEAIGAVEPVGARSVSRCAAGVVWAHIARLQDGTSTPGDLDDAELDRAVDALIAVDDAWEASRLLGQAALDHDDPAAAKALLERARLLVSEPLDSADGLLAAGLSEREAEVARLVAEGRTYKEIGAQLFISAKTVEHHVARVRQRLGSGSRAELLATIRELSGT